MALIRSSSKANGIFVFQQAASPASVAANTTAERDLTITGVLITDTLLNVVKPTAQAGLGIVGRRIKADNTVSLVFVNATASPIVPTASEVYEVSVLR